MRVRMACRSLRVELVDKPAEVVAPLLQAYQDVVQGKRTSADAWRWLQTIPDANGNVHGCSQGSLTPRAEPNAATLKLTAAAKRARQAQPF